MTLLKLSDSDGDPVAILASSIMAVSVGRLNGPTEGADPLTVTIVHTIAGPLIVSEPLGVVVAVWEQTLSAATAAQPLPQAALIGWQQQYDPTAPLPDPKVVAPRKGRVKP